ncbi:uncharacterized protein DS421_13g406610 [Arachis hypogaea]|nr:uncharacterized protein DS421_13g406610 [Arachis hypogaea]
MDPKCFIPSLLESMMVDSFNFASKLSVQQAMSPSPLMKTGAITEHWFEEEVEGSDQSGKQYGHGDDRVEEEGDDNDDDKS